jgi:hypothetical protein
MICFGTLSSFPLWMWWNIYIYAAFHNLILLLLQWLDPYICSSSKVSNWSFQSLVGRAILCLCFGRYSIAFLGNRSGSILCTCCSHYQCLCLSFRYKSILFNSCLILLFLFLSFNLFPATDLRNHISAASILILFLFNIQHPEPYRKVGSASRYNYCYSFSSEY